MKSKALLAGLAFIMAGLPAFAEVKIMTPQGERQNPWHVLASLGTKMENASLGIGSINDNTNPVRSDGTQFVREEREAPTQRIVSGRCQCLEYETVYDENGNENGSRCKRTTWQPGAVYQDVRVNRYYQIADPELYARSKASSAGIGTGIGVGLGLGAAAGLLTGLGLRFLAKTSIRVAGASAAIAGIATGIGMGIFFGSRAKGPAYSEALHRAQTSPNLPPETRVETRQTQVIDGAPPMYGTPCSPFDNLLPLIN